MKFRVRKKREKRFEKLIGLACERLMNDNTVKQPVYIVPEKLRGVPIKENLEEAMGILTKEDREEKDLKEIWDKVVKK
jgi:hypothetical protein